MEDIFKSYDIRGIYPTQINEQIVYKIGQAYAQFFDAKKVVIGRDMRTSSPALAKALVQGLVDKGCDVIDVGMCSTPMFYFAVGKGNYDGGLIITASHNPGAYNGIKVCRQRAMPVGLDTGLAEIKKLTEQVIKNAEKKGEIEKKDIGEEYSKHVWAFVNKERIKNKKVVVDCGNGMAGVTELNILKQLDCELIVLYEKPDGTFPNHEADPVKEKNLEKLKEEVKKQKADVGIAFDGDCDRVVFVDENAETVDGSLTAALIASELLKNKPKAKVVYSVIMSKIVPEKVLQCGGIPVLNRVGHACIKKTMNAENALFGAEKSGHFYYRENYNAESSVITILKVLELICTMDMPLSKLVEPLKRYATSEETNFEVKEKDKIIENVKRYYTGKNARIQEIDGVTIEFDDWWCNIRKSNTEPLLRLNIEANNKQLLKEKMEELKKFIVR